MKKLLTIIVLGLSWSNISLSEELMVPGINSPGLKNIKIFNLKIDSTVYEGSKKICDISYKEIEDFVKTTIYSKSNIKFSDQFGYEQFHLTTNILQRSNICSAEIKLMTYSWDKGRNTSNINFRGPLVSFLDRGQARIDDYEKFKKIYFDALEVHILKFLDNWKKYN